MKQIQTTSHTLAMPTLMPTPTPTPTPPILITPSIIKYILTFLSEKYYPDEANIILSVFKAFNSFPKFDAEDTEDPLREYKLRVQQYIACLVWSEVYVQLPEKPEKYSLTDFEVMYLYETFYGDLQTIQYGDREKMDISVIMRHEQHVDMEFMDITILMEDSIPDPRFYLDDEGLLNIKYLRFIRLVEQALLDKSEHLLDCILTTEMFESHLSMSLMYIYLKHNHAVYAPKYNSLASDETLIALLLKNEVTRPIIARVAISGLHQLFEVKSATAAHPLSFNIVLPNLAVVKQIIPTHIAPSELIPYWTDEPNDADDYAGYFSVPLLPIELWKQYNNIQTVHIPSLKTPDIVRALEKNQDIGEYLQYQTEKEKNTPEWLDEYVLTVICD